MIIINETLKARAHFPCDKEPDYEALYEHDPLWRQNIAGCFILDLLQDMFKFNVTYLLPKNYTSVTKYSQWDIINPRSDDSADIYVNAMSLEPKLLDNAYPVQPIFMWRFGFILRQRYNGLLKAFYTQPFTLSVWFCILCIIIFSSLMFYILSAWDKILYGTYECNFTLELLLAFSAFSQHVLPLQAFSFSRRTAYLSFIITAYVVHCFYTSNLLSHLVHDKNVPMDLQDLAESDYKIALLKDMNIITDTKKYEASMDKNLSIVWKKVVQLSIMDVPTALTAVMDSKTALLTDYIMLYPILKRRFETDEICQLVEIDLYSSVMYYFFTNKTFKYKEQFKIGSFRINEAGLIQRKQICEKYKSFKCRQATGQVTGQYHFQAQLDHVVNILLLLFACYLLSVVILIGERIHYNRNRVRPHKKLKNKNIMLYNVYQNNFK